MRIFHIRNTAASEGLSLDSLRQDGLPDTGFVWISCSRSTLEAQLGGIQALLHQLCGQSLLDFHVSDLLNQQLPSHYDYTSQYDMLVFRRLAAASGERASSGEPALVLAAGRGGPPILRRIDTSPVGFAVFERVLLTVHPSDCSVRDAYAAKLVQPANVETRSTGTRYPASPADLMLRVINLMVDGFLALRRELTHQLDHWQAELI
ncbi:MAG: magnesium transporter CorA, partial [Rhodoferax sp.]|nr:magnesium transporter CorA [Rhodoferax sp.]